MSVFCLKKKCREVNFLVFNSFSLLDFHVFLAKVLRKSSFDKNRNMKIFYKKKIPKLNYIYQNFFFLC